MLTVSPDGVTWERAEQADADVTIALSAEDLIAIADGGFDGRLAVASERMEITGDLELATRLLEKIEPEEA